MNPIFRSRVSKFSKNSCILVLGLSLCSAFVACEQSSLQEQRNKVGLVGTISSACEIKSLSCDIKS